MAIEATHDIGAVGFGCLHADVQHHGDFLATFSFSQKLHDLSLTSGEPQSVIAGVLIRALGIFVQVTIENDLTDLGRKEGFVAQQGFDRGDQIEAGIGFQ